MYAQSFGRPGIYNARIAVYRNVFVSGWWRALPQSGGLVIDGVKTRNPFGPRATDLQPGLLMGQITATKKYANSVLGAITVAVGSGGTTANVSPASATEIVRRIGPTGTINLWGPPTAGGTVAKIPVAYSAVNTTTGDVTIAAPGAALANGTLVLPNDGSETIKTFIPDGLGYTIDPDTSADLDFPLVPIEGVVDVAQLLPWSTDAAVKNSIRAALTATGASFVWNDLLSPL